MKPPIYDRNMVRLGTLQHAFEIGYKRVMNDLCTAQFTLPMLDEGNDLCESVNCIVDIFDGDRSVGKYRISDEPEEDIREIGAVHVYSCDHVIAFLFDDSIDGYLEIGGTGVTTKQVLNYLLSLQTPDDNGIRRWKLGRCEFEYQFQYSWENEDLCNAIFSVPKCFDDAYIWELDTASYPWTINLLKRETVPSCELRIRRNEKGIKRSRNRTNLCTRLYCYGSGEGVNQTNIRRVNPTGKNYIDSPYISQHGVICKRLIDRSISDDEMLYAKGKAYLSALEKLRYNYTISAIDLHKKTGLDYDLMEAGRLLRLMDEKVGAWENVYNLEVEKEDVEGDPLEKNIVISSTPDDVSSIIEDVSAKTAITAQYSQGATNLFPMQVTDNADEDHPAILKFYIPPACAKINAVKLSWQLSLFRAYAKGAKAGGGTYSSTSEGGDIYTTTEEGGGFYKTIEERVYDINAATTSAKSFSAGGASMTTTDAASTGITVAKYEGNSGEKSPETDSDSHSHTVNSHKHSIDGHRHPISSVDSGYTSYYYLNETGGAYPDTDSDSHSHTVKSHNHSINHSHTVTDPNHSHNMNHYHSVVATLTIPALSISVSAHSHSISVGSHTHSVELYDHAHDIVYGIYEGGMAESISISVDGKKVPTAKLVDSNGYQVAELDVVEYMATDDDGRITRGTWHEIELTPDSLTRIEAFLFVQTFITSNAGGNY